MTTKVHNEAELVLRVRYNDDRFDRSALTDALGETMRRFAQAETDATYALIAVDEPNGVLEGDYDWTFDAD